MDACFSYEKHLQFMQNVFAIADINDKDLKVQFDLLLSCLPNGGKFYKYRSLCGKSFEHAYNGLVNGYMWMPTADTLNDDYDSILITNAAEENKRFVDYVLQDYYKVLHFLLKTLGRRYWEEYSALKCISFDLLLEAFDSDTGQMDDNKMVNLFSGYDDAVEKLQQFKALTYRLVDSFRTALHQHTQELFMANENARRVYHVFSMSESYDLGNLWGYYADSGQGFCIEYDYNRAKTIGFEAMRYLLNTYKVEYSDIPRQIPPDLLAEAGLFDSDNPELQKRMKRCIFDRVLCKDICWEHEKEWRIILGHTDKKMPVDIVSAIIIDERSLQKTNAKKLIRLCKKRGWTVKVRKNRLYETSHSYEELVTRGNNYE